MKSELTKRDYRDLHGMIETIQRDLKKELLPAGGCPINSFKHFIRKCFRNNSFFNFRNGRLVNSNEFEFFRMNTG
jgi:hypothetical protein